MEFGFKSKSIDFMYSMFKNIDKTKRKLHQNNNINMYLLALVFSMGWVVSAVEKFSVEQLNSDHGKD